MQIRRYWLIVRRWLWLVVAMVVVAALASWLVAERTTPTYEAQVRLIVGPTFDSQGATFDTVRASAQLVVTYRELVKTSKPLDATITALKLPLTESELADRITVQSSDVTRILTIRVKDTSATRAANIANTLSNALVDQSNQSPELASRLTAIESAEPNTTPTAPNKPRILILGTTAGLLVVGGFILLVELLQGYIKTEDDLSEIAEAPVLATFPFGRRRSKSDPFFAGDQRQHPVDTAYQMAALKLMAGIETGTQGRTILVCGARTTAATAETTAYLSAACAQAGYTTLAIDADPASRELSRFFGCADDIGFADLVLEGEARLSGPARDIDEFAVPLRDVASVEGLHVLPAGQPLVDQSLPAEQLAATVDALRQAPSVTLISGPALTNSADALVLAGHVDAVLLVGVSDKTRATELRQAVENLELAHVSRLWTVMVIVSPLGRLARLPRLRGKRAPRVSQGALALEAARPAAPAMGA